MKRDDPRLVEVGAKAEGIGRAPAQRDAREGAPPQPGLEARLVRRLLASLGDPALRVKLWNGESVATGSGDPVAVVGINSRAALAKLLLHPELYFGEDYSDGSIEVEGDLVKLLELVYRGTAGATFPGALFRLAGRRRGNTLSASRENIHHHYDLGNDFYRLWLDQEMVYTCAYFPAPEATLEEAQIAKMDHVCRKLGLRQGESVIEAGCGWGALAIHMARRYGVRVRAFNISHEQIVYARGRARALGLEDRVEFVEDDYRNIAGRCDAFVSVGMLEHVGLDNYDRLGRVIDACLDGRGRGLLHSIGRARPAELNAWIDKRIFPGAYPPTLRQMLSIVEPREFSVLDVENLRLHYALTLRHWLQRFEGARDEVARMYDERFVRTWRLYLAGSIAAFDAGALQLFQVLFARHSNNELPWTREHLYARRD